MARKLFERQGIRVRGGALATGQTFVVYSDEAGTVLADISATSGGSAIAGSTVTVAAIAGLGPASFRIWGPTDGTAVLYLRDPDDPSLGVQEIEAEPEAGGGGVTDHGALTGLADDDHPQYATDTDLTTHAGAVNPHSVYALDTDLSTHEADTTAIHGITDTSALATTSGVTSAVSTHAGLTDPHTGYVLESLYDAKGDLLGASADNTPAKLTVGANDTVLTADSTAGTGLKWSAPAAHPNLATHDSLGLATDAELTTHAGAADPHAGYVLESLYDAKGDLLAASADNTPAKVTAGANATMLVADSAQTAGVKWAFGNAVAKHARRTTGDLTLNSTTLLVAHASLDFTLPAASGDILEFAIGGFMESATPAVFWDVATMVSAAPVNYTSSGNGTPTAGGITGWLVNGSAAIPFQGTAWLTLAAGDISAGTVTVRLLYKTATATNRTLNAGGDWPFYWGAKNLGPSAA